MVANGQEGGALRVWGPQLIPSGICCTQALAAAKGLRRRMAATAPADEAYRTVSAAVDAAFYRFAYPDLVEPGFDPIRHYLETGWREGRDPAPWFSVRGYLRLHVDVAASGAEPFSHYLTRGAAEQRGIVASDHAMRFRLAGGRTWDFHAPPAPEQPSGPPPASEPAIFHQDDRAVAAAEFDQGFYLEQNPDLARSGADPLEHFLLHGWREGRDPAPWFSVRDYLSANPDVEEAGVNPFVHFIAAGRAEGRAPRSRLGFRYKVLASQRPLESRIARAAARARNATPTLPEGFAGVAVESRTGLEDLHVTFSHDNYFEGVGGVQLCLQHESARLADRGVDHLHLYPTSVWPVLRRTEKAMLGVMLNGRPVGAYTPEAIARGLTAARSGRRGRGSFAIHNLLGHQVDEVLDILAAAGLEAGFFWLHDFTSLCAGYQLLRNDVQDCGAPPPDSPACGVCVYGSARMPQVADHERLFRKLKLTVVSPSQTTLDFWRASWSFQAARAVVHPHLRLHTRGPAAAPARASRPLRLAFLGQPSVHKGWPVFAELATDFAGDSRYEFLHLAARRDKRTPVEFHHVMVTLAEPHAMQRALERLGVDVAVIWSIFRETYCLAAYEAMAAGCAIVTCPDSANVAAMVEREGAGRVLADEAALAAALARGELQDLARSVRKPMLYDLEFSGMTADLLDAGVAA